VRHLTVSGVVRERCTLKHWRIVDIVEKSPPSTVASKRGVFEPCRANPGAGYINIRRHQAHRAQFTATRVE